jgi:electron transfer flavoprotein beta subunit
MPKLLVCYKWVLNEQDIKIRPDDLSLDSSRAKGKISDFDRNAIEAASLIVEQQGGTVDVLSYGTPAVKQSVKDVLSRGPNRLLWIGDPSAEEADAFVIANVLAAAIRKSGPYDLILCGEGSSDMFYQQIPARLAALLDLPCVTFIQKMTLEGGSLQATRYLGDCTEQVTVTGPAVVSVLSEMNKPRIPSLKQVLGAAKKPSEEIPLASLGLAGDELTPKAARKSPKGFLMNRKNVIFKESDPAANVAKLVASLAAEGLH